MNLKEKIDQDLIESMKAKDETKLSVLKMLKSAIKNQEIQKQMELADEDVLSLIQGQIKSRQDSIELFDQGGRPELAQKEQAEIDLLKPYLPEQMSEEEIKKLVLAAISQTGATGIQEMGKVMAVLMPQVKGKADGSLVSQVVKEELENK